MVKPKAKTQLQKVADTVKSYLFITFGIFIFVLGWTAFLIPSEIIGGGVSGIATIIYFATGIPVGASGLAINAVLVLVSIRILGARFGLSTIFGIGTGSLFFLILQPLITEPVVSEPFMATLIGSAMAGTGIGIAFNNGGNSGGTDIIALIINKYRNISPGKVILYLDVLIIASSYLVFESVEKLVYSYVTMAVFAYVLDLVIEGKRQSYQIMIFSEESRHIAQRIDKESGRGITILNGKGWFTQRDKEVLMIIAYKHDKRTIMRIVKEEDESAFISVAKVHGVFGENFDRIKL